MTQFPISDLDLFTNFATRAAYLAGMGKQAPPYNPALPIKGWADPAPTGQPYNVFDTTLGQVVQMSVPASSAGVNLPGVYNYPPFVAVPTDATEWGPFGEIGQVQPNTVCMQAAAQALAAAIAPLYPGKTVSVVDSTSMGIFRVVYGQDPRRQWGITVSPGGPAFTFAEALLELTYANGVGAPGHFAIVSGKLTWLADTPVTTAPAGAVTVPVPIGPLPPGCTFQFVNDDPSQPLFGSPIWMVVQTAAVPAITLAQVQALVAQYNAQPGVADIAIT